MGYTVKLATDAVTGVLFGCMAQRTRPDDRARAAESKFYLPAGPSQSEVASWVERVWAALFNHGIEPST